MYQIKCDNDILHDSRSNNIRVIEPKCEMELNKTGTLSFRISPTHPCFDSVKKHKSELSLYQDGEWIFTGRVLNDEVDIFGYKTVEVEGMLGYLLDSIQRPKEYHVVTSDQIEDYLHVLMAIHREQVDEKKEFSLGYCRVKANSNQLYKISSYNDTLSTINEDLVKTFGGYLSARFDGETRWLDYLQYEDLPINNQIIQLGKNILTFKQQVRGEDIATVILPLGEKKDSTGGSIVKEYVNLSELGYSKDGTIIHDDKSDCIYDEAAVEQYGRITKVIEWGDVTDPEDLLKKAKEQLNYYKVDDTSLELSVFDLHLLDVNTQSIRVGHKIRVISTAHNLDAYMVVQKMTLDLDQPDKSKIILTTVERSAIPVNSGSMSNKTTNTDKNIVSTQTAQQDMSDALNHYINTDLSSYAKIVDVNSAFAELATVIGGM